MTRSIALLPLAALAMACTQTPAMNNADQASADETVAPASNTQTPAGEGMADMPMVCDAEAVQDLAGKPYTEAVGQDAQTRSNARSMRLIRPGMAVTMDYRNDRLNIEVDDKNVITTVRCG
ncbi:Elastase inhibitor AFLEI Flags: Precursor [Sphingomonas gilva]|uniref:Peptidase inhibitor I78 family protein n=1 Tax=Sphingomonas gilva TaxID=2305907 RepID=A0A396RLL2_9SPHN|nr:I78 family peptidase inhibitor [Sphingomonas gilva]RHW17079.1 Elastase inhibitor AFLEI Flags: Precursor [Sphingomonas gilva]